MKALLLLLISLFSIDAHSGAGVNPVNIGVALAFMGSVIAILVIWLIFSLVVLLGRKKRINRLSLFRKAILAFIIFGWGVNLLISLIAFTTDWEILAYFLAFSICIIGLTELEILFFEKRHKKSFQVTNDMHSSK